MAPKRPLNAKNLETLGSERLAELLFEVSKGQETTSWLQGSAVQALH